MKSFNKSSAALLQAAVVTVASISVIKPLTARAGTSTNTVNTVQQGQSDGGTGNPSLNNPAITISFAGQTALKNYIISPAITELQPGTSIIFHDGTSGAPVTYTAPTSSITTVQFASKSFLTSDKNPGTPASPSTAAIQVASAVRTEWHEEGSVDGFVDLLNDEVGFVQTNLTSNNNGAISNEALRTPSVSNPTVVNQNTFTAGGSSGGFVLDNSSTDDLANTYDATVYNQITGVNIQGGQNRVQFSIGEYPTEALAVSGTASPFATAGSAGYGLGNTALTAQSNLTALGTANAREQFQPVSAANESTNKINPNTPSTAYTTGPWNSAGANNISSTAFAVTAVTYSANPGTGLQRIDLGDAQWLQTTGRLQNGALFNVVARTVNTGQRVVFALNTGIDPSWAVGSNDDGNSTSTTAANAQHSIGPSLRFDGKTSGSEAAITIGASRMAVGALSVPEARTNSSSSAPVRALDVDFTDQTDVNPSDDDLSNNKFIRANFNTIVSDGSAANGPHYGAVLISHFNTVKSPNQTALNNALTAEGINPATASTAQQQIAWASVQTFDPATAETDSTPSTAAISGIKGDTYGDVGAFLSNIINSDGTAAAGITTASANNPADGLFATGYLIPGLLDYTRTTDGSPVTPVTLSSAALAEQAQVNSNYGALFTTDGTSGANSNTSGTSSYYGGTGSSNGVAINGNILITAKDSSGNIQSNGTLEPAGNYLFGNFNQNGVRDYSAVQQAVNAALSLYAIDGAKSSMFTSDGGVANSTVIPSLVGTPGWVTTGTNTKGDLIALGDYNGDGKFDGADLYLLAIGASLADSTTSTTLTATYQTFSDVVRDPTKVLLKNTALDYINNYLNTTNQTAGAAFLRQTGRAVLTGTVPAGATDLGTTDPITGLEQYTFDPTGANAFNKNDVNRDGVVDFNDAVLVDQYAGQSYENLTQSLAATAQTPVTGAIEPISLVAVQQVDGESSIGSADLAVLSAGLTGTGLTNWYGYALTKTGTGTINYGRTGGTVTVSSGASFVIDGGTVNVGKTASGSVAGAIDPFTDSTATGIDTSKSLAVTISNATLDYAARTGAVGDTGIKIYRTGSLSLQTGGLVSLDSPASQSNRTLLVTGSLAVSGGTLNLGSNDLVIHNGNAVTTTALIRQGFNGGTWSGSGITSSIAEAAATAGTDVTALGIELNSTGSGTLLSSFDGQPVTSTDVLVKYTYFGDADLSGTVNGSDYTLIDTGFNNQYTGWHNGDFNYDGVVNGDDYTLIDNAFNNQTSGPFVSSSTPQNLIATATDQIASPASAVPEPGSLSLVAMSAGGLLARRRRRA